MSIRTLRILIYGTLTFLCLMIGIGTYQKHFGEDSKTYAEFQHSLYKVSNQCIADYYSDHLTTQGYIFSYYPIIPECEAVHKIDSVVKIYDADGQQQAEVKAYKLQGVMLDIGANGCFMNRVVLRRESDGKVVRDVTDIMIEKHPEDEITVEESSLAL